jgi:hypothetical protein
MKKKIKESLNNFVKAFPNSKTLFGITALIILAALSYTLIFLFLSL